MNNLVLSFFNNTFEGPEEESLFSERVSVPLQERAVMSHEMVKDIQASLSR